MVHGDFSKEFALASVDAWQQLPEPPDAIFAIHYLNAVEIIQYAKELGIEIPQKLGIVGFGDEYLAEIVEPALTVFHLFPQKVGEVAAALLFDVISNKEARQQKDVLVQGQLIIRKSSLKKG